MSNVSLLLSIDWLILCPYWSWWVELVIMVMMRIEQKRRRREGRQRRWKNLQPTRLILSPPNLIRDPWGGNWSVTAALFIGGFVREGEHFSSVKYNVSRKYGLSKKIAKKTTCVTMKIICNNVSHDNYPIYLSIYKPIYYKMCNWANAENNAECVLMMPSLINSTELGGKFNLIWKRYCNSTIIIWNHTRKRCRSEFWGTI